MTAPSLAPGLPGSGVTAELLTQKGIPVYGESRVPALLAEGKL